MSKSSYAPAVLFLAAGAALGPAGALVAVAIIVVAIAIGRAT